MLAHDAKLALERVERGEDDAMAGWIAYGAALNEGRAQFHPEDDKGFGKWVDDSLLYQVGTVEVRREDRAAAMWAAREPVKDYAALAKIAPDAWQIVGATIREPAPIAGSDVAPAVGATAPFTAGILRSILSLHASQQVDLVRRLARGKCQKIRLYPIQSRERVFGCRLPCAHLGSCRRRQTKLCQQALRVPHGLVSHCHLWTRANQLIAACGGRGVCPASVLNGRGADLDFFDPACQHRQSDLVIRRSDAHAVQGRAQLRKQIRSPLREPRRSLSNAKVMRGCIRVHPVRSRRSCDDFEVVRCTFCHLEKFP